MEILCYLSNEPNTEIRTRNNEFLKAYEFQQGATTKDMNKQTL